MQCRCPRPASPAPVSATPAVDRHREAAARITCIPKEQRSSNFLAACQFGETASGRRCHDRSGRSSGGQAIQDDGDDWHQGTIADWRSDILHPSRANISKEELREKLGGLYKAQKDQVQVFGLRTQFGGGKTTGFALIYDSPEAMKKFEPNYRLVRVGMATKAERASRQQRTSLWPVDDGGDDGTDSHYRQAAQEPTKDAARHGKGQGCQGEEGQISGEISVVVVNSGGRYGALGLGILLTCECWHVVGMRDLSTNRLWQRLGARGSTFNTLA